MSNSVSTMRKPKREDARASSLFERALDNLPDGVLLVREGKTIVYANSAFEKIWNVPPGIVGTGDDSALLPWVANQVADTAAFVGEVKRLYGSLENSEDMVALKDGRMISRRSVPFQEDNTLHTRIWIFTDVTEARHACIDTMTACRTAALILGTFRGRCLPRTTVWCVRCRSWISIISSLTTIGMAMLRATRCSGKSAPVASAPHQIR